MLKIHNLEEKLEYIDEICILTQLQWGSKCISKQQFNEKISNKKNKILSNFNNKFYCKLILLNDEELVGFISIFPTDGEEELNLTPWYATMYVKDKYRKKGYSKILNDAILNEARNRNINKLYLKTDLENYYEKFGAKYMKKLSNGEKLYCFDL